MDADIRALADSLFGPATTPAETLSVRDAITRASQLTSPDDAAVLLQLATTSGDRDLARAIAARCFEAARIDHPDDAEAWERVLARWVEFDDGAAELLAAAVAQ